METKPDDLENLLDTAQKISQQLGSINSFANLMETCLNLLKSYLPQRNFYLLHRLDSGVFLVLNEDVQKEGGALQSLAHNLKKLPSDEFLDSKTLHLEVGDISWQIFLLARDGRCVAAFSWQTFITDEEQHVADFILHQTSLVGAWCDRLEQTQKELYRDDLTGLYNHRYLDDCLENEIRRVQRFENPFSLLFIDLDGFKPINDTFGHLSGSEVLKQVAMVLMGELRDVDSIFRYGGDEFVILLLEIDSQRSLGVAERIRQRVAGFPFETLDKKAVRLTCSIGIACCPEHARDKETLLKLADESMYQSKHGGKDRVRIYSQEDSNLRT